MKEAEINFSSFLAGFFLVNRDAANLDFSRLMSMFQIETNIEFTENDPDSDKIHDLFYLDQRGIHLRYDYDDVITYNNVQYRVYDYLYRLTNDVVRNYFNIANSYVYTMKNEFNQNKRRG